MFLPNGTKAAVGRKERERKEAPNKLGAQAILWAGMVDGGILVTLVAASDTLKQSEGKYRQLFETVADAILVFDEEIRGQEAHDVTVLDVSDYQPQRVPSKTWRELIKKIWEVGPLCCPRCTHEMKIISLIHEPDVIERILRHLGLWKQHQDPHVRKTKAPALGPVVLEDFDDGWPRYEEPVN